MNHRISIALFLLLPACLGAAAAQPKASEPPSDAGRFVFSLLPKAFQKNPSVDLAVITEMTDEGRKRSEATAGKPVYYIAETTGYHDEGMGITGERPLPIEQLTAALERSLHSNHYVVSDAAHPATEVIFFVWGSHNKLDEDILDPNNSAFTDIGHANLLSRVSLVGGTKFAHEFAVALNDHDSMVQAGVSGIGPDPISIFMNKSPRNMQLIEQAYDDCFYVVASAYDIGSIAKGKRTLLWRTKMTTNSQGLAMKDSLPMLIDSGGPYFGRDMTDAATISRRVLPEGHVEVGTPTEVKSADH